MKQEVKKCDIEAATHHEEEVIASEEITKMVEQAHKKEIVVREEWFECASCNKKMETANSDGSASAFDIFGISDTNKALYCNNKECDKFGY